MSLRLKTLRELLSAFRVKYTRPWRGVQGFSQFHPCLSLQAHLFPLCRGCSGHSEWYAMSSPASAFALTPAWRLSIPHATAQSLKRLWSFRTPFMCPIPQSGLETPPPGSPASWFTFAGTCALYTRLLAFGSRCGCEDVGTDAQSCIFSADPPSTN